MSIKESYVVNKIKQDLRKIPNCWMYKTADRFSVGIPDILACIDGVFVALEIKKETNARDARLVHRSYAIQSVILEQIKAAGGYGAFVYGLDGWSVVKQEMLEFVRQFNNNKK